MKNLLNIIEGILDVDEISGKMDKEMLEKTFASLLGRDDKVISYRNGILTIQSIDLRLSETSVAALEELGIKKLILTGKYSYRDFYISCPGLLKFEVDNQVQDLSNKLRITCTGIQKSIKSAMGVIIRSKNSALQLNKIIEAPNITLFPAVSIKINSTFKPITKCLKIIYGGSGGLDGIIRLFKSAEIVDDKFYMNPQNKWDISMLDGFHPCKCLGLKQWKLSSLIIGAGGLASGHELAFFYKKSDRDLQKIPNSDWVWKWNYNLTP